MLPLLALGGHLEIQRWTLFKRHTSRTSMSNSSFVAILYDTDAAGQVFLTPAYLLKGARKSCDDSRELHKYVALLSKSDTHTVKACSRSGPVSVA